MACFKCSHSIIKKRRPKYIRKDSDSDDNDRQQEEDKTTTLITDQNVEEVTHDDKIKLVYFASITPNQNVIDILNKTHKYIQTFTDENECVEYIKSITNKIFLIIDGQPSTTIIQAIESFKQLDSVFFYSPLFDTIVKNQHTYICYLCENVDMLRNAIHRSCEEHDKQTAIFNKYNNNKEKSIYNLSKEQGSFLCFQLFKFLLKNMPKINEAKSTMITLCRNYYRGNLIELANIDDFDRTYKSCDAILWFTKEIFLYEFINKTLRTQNFDLFYSLRFYMMDLSEQIEFKFEEFKMKKQINILKLYRPIQITQDEMIDYQNNIGNLISNNEYLLTSSEHSIAYEFVKNLTKQEGVVRVLFEYLVDLNVVRNIVIADVRQCSAFPEKAQFIVDIGASFQIDSCEYNAEEDLWYIKLHAIDEVTDLVVEYIEYQKKRMIESNLMLFFGNLLIEMGEYDNAERYFDTILNGSNPNDQEISCIFFNFGRIHCLKGNFNRAINCYNRAYYLHINARPKRRASAGKTMNGLGIVYIERGQPMKAEECFQRAMRLYKRSLPKKHVDVAKTLINLGTVDCNRQNFEQALKKYQKAKKIFDNSLPLFHPNRALVRVNFGNVYLATKNYQMALDEYEVALKLQEASLRIDHPDIVQTLHNLAIVHAYQKNINEAKNYLKRANEIVNQNKFSLQHPLKKLLNKTKDFIDEE